LSLKSAVRRKPSLKIKLFYKNGAKMTKIKTLGISLAVATALSFSGCGSSDSTTPPADTKNITGTISGNGYAKNDIINRFLNNIITPAYALPLDAPDKIVVIYDVSYNETTNKMDIGYKEFPIDAVNGTFDIDTSLLSKNKLVVLVVNSTTKEVFGNLNLGTSGDDKLDFFDKSKLSDDIALGNIDTESNCSTSATVSSVGAFSNDDITTLEKIAKLDNGLKTYGNHYRNLDSENKIWIDSTIEYAFHADTITNITSQQNDISDFNSSKLSYKGINVMSQDWGSVSDSNISLYPPSAIKVSTSGEGGVGTYTNDANQTQSVTIRGCSGTGNDWKDCGVMPVDIIPSGIWNLKIENVQKAKFEFKDVNPFEANGKLKVPIPKVKVNMNGNFIASVNIQWYIYNGTTYEEATEEIMNSIGTPPDGTHPQVSIADNNHQSLEVDIPIDNWNGDYPMPSDKQNVVLGTGNGEAKYISMEYNIGQVRYYFRFYN
jgi:hypothetical protein